MARDLHTSVSYSSLSVLLFLLGISTVSSAYRIQLNNTLEYHLINMFYFLASVIIIRKIA